MFPRMTRRLSNVLWAVLTFVLCNLLWEVVRRVLGWP